MLFDVAIVGGGVAGLQAALTLVRSQRSVLLIDEGLPRHRFAARMHNFIGADGATPAEFYGKARDQLAAYPHFAFHQTRASSVAKTTDGFAVTLGDGTQYAARKMLFATGVKDVLPLTQGLQDFWGTRVLHCSYCHGYEARDQQLAVFTTAADAPTMLESLWPLSQQLRFFFAGPPPGEALAASLTARGISVVMGYPIRAEAKGNGLQLVMLNGQTHDCDALFVKTQIESASPLLFELGCTYTPTDIARADEWGTTGVAGVFVAGDISGQYHQFTAAAKSGMNAAVMIHTELTQASLR